MLGITKSKLIAIGTIISTWLISTILIVALADPSAAGVGGNF